MARKLAIACLIMVVTAGCGCWGVSYDFYNIRKIGLDDMERQHAVDLARAYLTKTTPPPEDLDRYKDIYAREVRGVFISAIRDNQAALTAFALGESIEAALKSAAANLRRMAANEDLNKLRLRVDVIDETTDEKSRNIRKDWGTDFSKEGLIFATEPPLAMLPQEIRDWRVIDEDGDYSYSQLKKLLKARNIGRDVRNQIRESVEIAYARFTVVSFMEDETGKLTTLWRGNRARGYEVSAESLATTLKAASGYIVGAVKDDGAFEYKYDPRLSRDLSSYNERFHAGTTYAMLVAYKETGDAKLLEAAKRALGWMQENSLPPKAEDRDKLQWRALANSKLDHAKLGGSGAALVAFSEYTRQTGDKQYLPLMRDYAAFIEWLTGADGLMRTKYFFKSDADAKYSTAEGYYPGEAIAGLVALYGVDPDPRWLELAIKGVTFIAEVRDKSVPDTRLLQDFWMVHAIHALQQVAPEKAHVDYAWRVFKAIAYHFNDVNNETDLVGSFDKKPSMSGTARCLAALTLLHDLGRATANEEHRNQLVNMLTKGAAFVRRNQYDAVNTIFFNHPSKARGGFMYSFWDPMIQIDGYQYGALTLINTSHILFGQNGRNLN
jgi:hypothetical protein